MEPLRSIEARDGRRLHEVGIGACEGRKIPVRAARATFGDQRKERERHRHVEFLRPPGARSHRRERPAIGRGRIGETVRPKERKGRFDMVAMVKAARADPGLQEPIDRLRSALSPRHCPPP